MCIGVCPMKSIDGPVKYKFRKLKCATIDELRYMYIDFIKAEMLDYDETDLCQLLMTNLSMVGKMNNNSYTTVDSQPRTSLKLH